MAGPLQFAYRTQKAIGLFNAAKLADSPVSSPVAEQPDSYAPVSGFVKPEGNLRCCVYSPCGRYFAYASNEGVSVVDASAGNVLASLSHLTTVYELGFSPQGTFLATWERPAKDEAGDATKNLKIWRTIESLPEGTTKEPLGQFVQKSQNGWNLKYTSDEKFCARVVTNEVQFYDSNDLKTVWNKLRVEGVIDFALAPGNSENIAIFVPERKVCLNLILHSCSEDSLSIANPRCVIGTTCYCQGLQYSPVCEPHLPEDLFQGRQGPAEVEPAGLKLDCAGTNGCGQV